MTSADDCVFCSIIAGETAAEIVLATDDAVGFLDRSPLFVGHVLVVPRMHVVTLADLPGAMLRSYFSAVQTVSAAVPGALGAQGSFVAMNNVVSQSVPHLHTHVVPRTKGDGLRGFFWPRAKYAEGQAAEVGRRLRDAISPRSR